MTTSLPFVGFIGLGAMGKPMALNLLKAGHPLGIVTRRPETAAFFTEKEALVFTTPDALAREASAIFLCLPDTCDVEQVLFGPHGIADALKPGTLVIDCSTISAAATRDFAAKLKAKGADLIDCPVSGGVKGAEAGTLSGMVGGDVEAVGRAMPILKAIGSKFIHAGPSGSGQVVKACNQLIIAATMVGVGEAVALCRNFGLDPEIMRNAISGGAADSFVLQNHAKRLITGSLAPGFRASLMLKDLKLAAALAEATGTSTPATSLALQQFTRLCESNRGDLDSAAVGLLASEKQIRP